MTGDAVKKGLAPRVAGSSKSRVSWGDEEDVLKLGTLKHVPKGEIGPDPEQPRTSFDVEALLELQASIEEHGILQPILVRELAEPIDGVRYRILTGERRWRAASASRSIESVPVVVRSDLSDDLKVLLAQIAENVHRSDMNPLDLANAYRRVFESVGENMEEAAHLLGLSKSRLSLVLSVEKAPQEVRELVEEGVTTDVNVLNGLSVLNGIDRGRANELIEKAKSGELKGGGLRKAVNDGVREEKRKRKVGQQGVAASVSDTENDGAKSGNDLPPSSEAAPVAIAVVEPAAPVLWNVTIEESVLAEVRQALEIALQSEQGKPFASSIQTFWAALNNKKRA